MSLANLESTYKGENMEFNETTYKQKILEEAINNVLVQMRDKGISRKGISDGYHTFGELYYHRMVLFSIICNKHKEISWKSKQHDDGTMFDESFIVGITTPQGDYTYHYHLRDWDKFDVREIDKAPKWDGHKPSDIGRLLSI